MRTTFAIAGFLVFACLVAVAGPPLALNVNTARGELEVRHKNQKLLVYAFATNQFKPYVRELCTLRRENVLRDSPADHLHHHGLMYAIHVNGVNFWEEKVEPGIEKSLKLLESPLRLPQVRFTQTIHWVASTNGAVAEPTSVALLVESRTLSLTVNEADDEVALSWESSFEVGQGADKVKLHGTEYNGLGARLPQSFDHVARFQNSEDTARADANGRNVIGAKWSSVTGLIDGHEITIAILGDPANKSGNRFFTMLEPFAYLGATQALDRQPLEYSRGETFRLRYVVLVYSEPKSREFLNQRYETWQQELNRK